MTTCLSTSRRCSLVHAGGRGIPASERPERIRVERMREAHRAEILGMSEEARITKRNKVLTGCITGYAGRHDRCLQAGAIREWREHMMHAQYAEEQQEMRHDHKVATDELVYDHGQAMTAKERERVPGYLLVGRQLSARAARFCLFAAKTSPSRTAASSSRS